MLKVVVGLAVFIVVAVFAVLVVYPFIFGLVSSLFETGDVGTIVGLVACVLITVPLIWLAIGLTFAAVAITAIGEDRRKFNRQVKNRSNR